MVTSRSVVAVERESVDAHDRSSTVVVSSDVAAAEWDRYVEEQRDATADHLWHWRTIFENVFGHRTTYLAARRGSQIVGVLPLVLFKSRLFGRSVVSVPFLNYGGVVADDTEAAYALIEHARDLARHFGASHVELRHTRRQRDDLPFRQHKVGLVRALPATSELLWQETDRKVRNQVRKAQKEGLTTVSGGGELVDEFYGVFAENMRDLGTPVYAKALFKDSTALFGDRVRVFLVRAGQRPAAGGIAIRFRDTVLVPWASSRRELRHLCPNMLLYWTMLEHATTSDAATFDFGRSTPGGGTHHFKLQWGAQPTPLHWEYVLLTRSTAPDHGPTNPTFKTAIDVWKHCPLWLANAIGPHIVRAIP